MLAGCRAVPPPGDRRQEAQGDRPGPLRDLDARTVGELIRYETHSPRT